MKAMILSAGRGERMRPLTDTIPKPLIRVHGRPLIEHHIERLKAAGIVDMVINLGWLGELLRQHLGNGEAYGVAITYSDEHWPALETGGGIFKALPLLGEEPFAVINGDVWTDYPLGALIERARNLAANDLGHLVLVANPLHNPEGDFDCQDGRVLADSASRRTFSGLSVLRAALFAGVTPSSGLKPEVFPLAPLLRKAANAGQLAGEIYDGQWLDVGTPDRHAALEAMTAPPAVAGSCGIVESPDQEATVPIKPEPAASPVMDGPLQ